MQAECSVSLPTPRQLLLSPVLSGSPRPSRKRFLNPTLRSCHPLVTSPGLEVLEQLYLALLRPQGATCLLTSPGFHLPCQQDAQRAI